MRYLYAVLVVVTFLATGCANNPPPTLSPQAAHAYQAMRATKDLDVLMDVATSANATVPPVLDEATTRKVVQYHQAAVTIIHDAQAGWQAAIQTATTEFLKVLPADARAALRPYIALVQAGIQELIR